MANQSICCFDLLSGNGINPTESTTGSGLAETGHFMKITALAFRETYQELYSSSRDGMILRWSSHFPCQTPRISNRITREERCEPEEQAEADKLSDWESDID